MWKNDIRCKCMFLFPLSNWACKGLTENAQVIYHWYQKITNVRLQPHLPGANELMWRQMVQNDWSTISDWYIVIAIMKDEYYIRWTASVFYGKSIVSLFSLTNQSIISRNKNHWNWLSYIFRIFHIRLTGYHQSIPGTWWHHTMEMVSDLMALGEGNHHNLFVVILHRLLNEEGSCRCYDIS